MILDRPMVLFNFTGAYEKQEFWKEYDPVRLDCRNMPGTNCYCDQEARALLEERINQLPLHGMHFLDSGNYHYITRLWLERVDRPFALLVIDNHTDMQPPAFGGLLSCGGWAADAAESLPLLKKIWLAGPGCADLEQIPGHVKEKLTAFSGEELAIGENWRNMLGQIPADLPLYVSIDKDVLTKEEVPLNWNQGETCLEQLVQALGCVWNTPGREIIGVDICGECREDACSGAFMASSRVNRVLAQCIGKTL